MGPTLLVAPEKLTAEPQLLGTGVAAEEDAIDLADPGRIPAPTVQPRDQRLRQPGQKGAVQEEQPLQGRGGLEAGFADGGRIGKVEQGHGLVGTPPADEAVEGAPIGIGQDPLGRLAVLVGLPVGALAPGQVLRQPQRGPSQGRIQFPGDEQEGVSQRLGIQPPPMGAPVEAVVGVQVGIAVGLDAGEGVGGR